MSNCTIEDFGKLDIKVGTVKQVEKVENTRNLLKLEVDIGEEKRTLVAGLASTHAPEDLMDKQVPVLVNLEAKEIMGVESHGMLLAADMDGEAVLLHPEKKVKSGAKIR
ncbi:MAG: methionine--tRNA ligase [Elusimicrobiota bacterium]